MTPRANPPSPRPGSRLLPRQDRRSVRGLPLVLLLLLGALPAPAARQDPLETAALLYLDRGSPWLVAQYEFEADGSDRFAGPAAETENVRSIDGALAANGAVLAGSRVAIPFPSLNYGSFAIAFDLHLPGFPAGDLPLLVGGPTYRWLEVRAVVDPFGSAEERHLRLTFNGAAPGGAPLDLDFPEARLIPARWHRIVVSADAFGGSIDLALDGERHLPAAPGGTLVWSGFRVLIDDLLGKAEAQADRVFVFADPLAGPTVPAYLDNVRLYGSALPGPLLREALPGRPPPAVMEGLGLYNGLPVWHPIQWEPGIFHAAWPPDPSRLVGGAFEFLYSSSAAAVVNGSVTHEGQIYRDSALGSTPYTLAEQPRRLWVLQPGSDAEGATLTAVVGETNVFTLAGAFARADDSTGSGDGAEVRIFRNEDLGHPLFAARIPPETAGHGEWPFDQPGHVPFSFTTRLDAGDRVHFAVFAGDAGEATADATAVRVDLFRGHPVESPRPPADVEIYSMSVTPPSDGDFGPGELIWVDLGVRNKATGPMLRPARTIVRILPPPGVDQPALVLRDFEEGLGILSAGQSTFFSLPAWLPDTLPFAGECRLEFEITPFSDDPDPANQRRSVPLRLARPAGMDLVVTGFAARFVVADPDYLEATWTTTNSGTLPAPAPWVNQVLITDGYRTNELVGPIVQTNTIAAGAAQAAQAFNWVRFIPGRFGGLVRIGVQLDATHALAELSEDNNVAWSGPIDIGRGFDFAGIPQPPEVAESPDPGPIAIQVTRVGEWGVELVATIENPAPTQLALTNRLVFPVGVGTVTLPLRVLPDGLPLGDRAVPIRLTAPGYPDGYGFDLTILDRDGPDLVVEAIHAPEVLVPGAQIDVEVVARNRGKLPVPGGWQADLVLVDSPGASEREIPLARWSITNAPAEGASRSLVATVALPAFLPAGAHLLAARVDTANQIAEAFENNNRTDRTATIPLALVWQPEELVFAETDAPAPVLLRRNGDLATPLVASLASSAPAELDLPASITFAAGHDTVPLTLTPRADGVLDGDQSGTITASADAHRSATARFVVHDADVPALTLSLDRASLREGQAIDATVRRNGPTDAALVVTLGSSAPSEFALPSAVTIPAGQDRTRFAISAVADGWVEGPELHRIHAAAPGFTASDVPVTVEDGDDPELAVELQPAIFSESAGSLAATLVVQRRQPTPRPLMVALTTDPPGIVHVPSSIDIPADQSLVLVPVGSIDNADRDGTRIAVVSAVALADGSRQATGPTASLPATVTDDDGPLLEVIPERAVVREGQSVSITLRRRGDATAELFVDLATADPPWLDLPAQVRIPAGAVETVFSGNGRGTAASDGTHAIEIVATAPGFAASRTMVYVTDAILPNLVIAAVSGPATAEVGDQPVLRFTLRNEGFAPLTRPVSQRVHLSRDPFVGDDLLIGTYPFQPAPAGLAADASAEPIAITCPYAFSEPGDYWLMVEADVNDDVAEIREDDNRRIAAVPIRVEPSFTTRVRVDLPSRVQPAGTAIPFTGTITGPRGRSVAGERVDLAIDVREYRRVISGLADFDGTFRAVFQPLPGEAGHYSVMILGAADDDAGARDEFTLLGARFEPAALGVVLEEGTSESLRVQLHNAGDAPLTRLAASVVGSAAGLTASARVAADRVDGFGDVEITVSLAAVAPVGGAPRRIDLLVRVATAEGSTHDLPLAVTLEPKRARLRMEPAELVGAMVPGQPRSIEATLVNDGHADSGPISVALPDVPWLRLAGSSPLDSLAPGAIGRITLLLDPPADLPLGPYEGRMVLQADSGTSALPFVLRAVSEARGDLAVTVVDEFTYYAEGAPRVAGARITVRDPFVAAIVAEGVTDSTGRWSARGLPEGLYELEATADDHGSFFGNAVVVAGQENAAEAFLSRELVKYTWTVEPTTVPDRTRIALTATFEGSVPLPLVRLQPESLDIEQTLAGRIAATFELTVTNLGLLAAENVQLTLPEPLAYEATALVTHLGTLPARSAVQVPIRIARPVSLLDLVDTIAPAPRTFPSDTRWETALGPATEAARALVQFEPGGQANGEYVGDIYLSNPTSQPLAMPMLAIRAGTWIRFDDELGGSDRRLLILSPATGRILAPGDVIRIRLVTRDSELQLREVGTQLEPDLRAAYQAWLDRSLAGGEAADARARWESAQGNLTTLAAAALQACSPCTTAVYATDSDLETWVTEGGCGRCAYADPNPEIAKIWEDFAREHPLPETLPRASAAQPAPTSGLTVLTPLGDGRNDYPCDLLAQFPENAIDDSLEDTEEYLKHFFVFAYAPIFGLESTFGWLAYLASTTGCQFRQSYTDGSSVVEGTRLGFVHGFKNSVNTKAFVRRVENLISLIVQKKIRDGEITCADQTFEVNDLFEKYYQTDGFLHSMARLGLIYENADEIPGLMAGGVGGYFCGPNHLADDRSVSGNVEVHVETKDCSRGVRYRIVPKLRIRVTDALDLCDGDEGRRSLIRAITLRCKLLEAKQHAGALPYFVDFEAKTKESVIVMPDRICLEQCCPQLLAESHTVKCGNRDVTGGAVASLYDGEGGCDSNPEIPPFEAGLPQIFFRPPAVNRTRSCSSADPAPRLPGETAPAADPENICARVRIQLDQSSVSAREAFRARLELENRRADTLRELRVDLVLRRGDGTDATDRFALPAPSLDGLSAVDGTGSLGGGRTGSATWRLIPVLDAAPAGPTVYRVGGTLAYTEGTTRVTIPLAEVPITVHPAPRLLIDYFHQRDVFSDDPFTEVLEPALPFDLAVMVRNAGAGVASGVRLDSAQPAIVDNEKGLRAEFQLVATEVEGRRAPVALSAEFGTVAPGTNAIGRWVFTSSLQGLFLDYHATFEHLDAVAGRRTAVVDGVAIHEMIHVVEAPGNFTDGRPDFLLNEVPDLEDLPDTVWLSDGSTRPVTVPRSVEITGGVPASGGEITLIPTPTPGFAYLRIPDPAGATGEAIPRLVSVRRSDGTDLPTVNFWQTDRTFVGLGRRPIRENRLHLFDLDPAESYTLVYAPAAAPDGEAPSSHVEALPAEVTPVFPVRWSGTDDVPGLLRFDVFVSTNGGEFQAWRRDTTETAALFTGIAGSRYAFYSVARDAAGQRELPPASADTATVASRRNQAPRLEPIPDQVVLAGARLELPVLVSDPDGDAVTLTLRAGPAGLTLDSDGVLRWVAGPRLAPATYRVTVEAVDTAQPAASTTITFPIALRSVNGAPIAGMDILRHPVGKRVRVSERELLANDGDPDGDALTITAVASRGANGGTVRRAEGWITYQPPDAGTAGDRFTYTISDGGREATGTVLVLADTSDSGAASLNIVATRPDSEGGLRLVVTGVPGRRYAVQRAASLLDPAWETRATATADANGRFEFIDPQPPLVSGFYRAIEAPAEAPSAESNAAFPHRNHEDR